MSEENVPHFNEIEILKAEEAAGIADVLECARKARFNQFVVPDPETELTSRFGGQIQAIFTPRLPYAEQKAIIQQDIWRFGLRLSKLFIKYYSMVYGRHAFVQNEFSGDLLVDLVEPNYNAAFGAVVYQSLTHQLTMGVWPPDWRQRAENGGTLFNPNMSGGGIVVSRPIQEQRQLFEGFANLFGELEPHTSFLGQPDKALTLGIGG